jgi:hypothetical protein
VERWCKLLELIRRKHKISRWKEIIMNKAEIHEIKKNYKESMNQKAGSLTR